MTPRRQRLDPTVLRRMYEDEELPSTEIARRTGYGVTSICRWMRADGIAQRRQKRPSAEELRGLYWDEGKSSTEIADQLGVSFASVCRWLHEADVPLRSESERAAHWLAQRSEDERRDLMKAAQGAVRGMKRSHADLCQRAARKQRTLKPSALEAELLDALRALDLHPTLNFAVDKYNIDLAFPDEKVGVEVDGGNWHNSAKKRRADQPKQAFLEAQGWTVRRFSNQRGSNRPIKGWAQKAADAVAQELSLLQSR